VAVYHKSVKCNPLTPLDFVEQFVSTIDKILRRGIRVSCYMSVTSVAMAELTVRHYYSLPVSLGGLLGSDIRRFLSTCIVAIRTSTTCKLIIDTILDHYVYNVTGDNSYK